MWESKISKQKKYMIIKLKKIIACQKDKTTILLN